MPLNPSHLENPVNIDPQYDGVVMLSPDVVFFNDAQARPDGRKIYHIFEHSFEDDLAEQESTDRFFDKFSGLISKASEQNIQDIQQVLAKNGISLETWFSTRPTMMSMALPNSDTETLKLHPNDSLSLKEDPALSECQGTPSEEWTRTHSSLFSVSSPPWKSLTPFSSPPSKIIHPSSPPSSQTVHLLCSPISKIIHPLPSPPSKTIHILSSPPPYQSVYQLSSPTSKTVQPFSLPTAKAVHPLSSPISKTVHSLSSPPYQAFHPLSSPTHKEVEPLTSPRKEFLTISQLNSVNSGFKPPIIDSHEILSALMKQKISDNQTPFEDELKKILDRHTFQNERVNHLQEAKDTAIQTNVEENWEDPIVKNSAQDSPKKMSEYSDEKAKDIPLGSDTTNCKTKENYSSKMEFNPSSKLEVETKTLNEICRESDYSQRDIETLNLVLKYSCCLNSEESEKELKLPDLSRREKNVTHELERLNLSSNKTSGKDRFSPCQQKEEAEAKVGPKTEAEAEPESKVDAEAEAEAKIEGESGNEDEVEAEAKIESEVEVEAEAETEVEAETLAEAEVDVEAESEAEAEVETETEAEAKTEEKATEESGQDCDQFQDPEVVQLQEDSDHSSDETGEENRSVSSQGGNQELEQDKIQEISLTNSHQTSAVMEFSSNIFEERENSRSSPYQLEDQREIEDLRDQIENMEIEPPLNHFQRQEVECESLHDQFEAKDDASSLEYLQTSSEEDKEVVQEAPDDRVEERERPSNEVQNSLSDMVEASDEIEGEKLERVLNEVANSLINFCYMNSLQNYRENVEQNSGNCYTLPDGDGREIPVIKEESNYASDYPEPLQAQHELRDGIIKESRIEAVRNETGENEVVSTEIPITEEDSFISFNVKQEVEVKEETWPEYSESKENGKHLKCSHCCYFAHNSLDFEEHELSHSSPKVSKYKREKVKKSECLNSSSSSRKSKKKSRTSGQGAETEDINSEVVIKSEPGQSQTKYRCLECNYATNFHGNLRKHERSQHGRPPNKIKRIKTLINKEIFFRCSKCEYTGHTNALLKRHLMSHLKNRKIKCSKCDYSAHYNSYMKDHELTHSNARPHKCSICGFASKLKSNLAKHEAVHSKRRMKHGAKAFQYFSKLIGCSKCDFKAAHKFIMIKHEMTHLKSKSSRCRNKTLSCSKCEYSTSLSKELREHKKMHSNPRQFKCSKCNFASKSKRNLKKHESVHLRQISDLKSRFHRPLPQQKKFFKSDCKAPNIPVEHESGHLELEPFICSHCSFTTQSNTPVKKQEKINIIKIINCRKCGCATSNKNQLEQDSTHLPVFQRPGPSVEGISQDMANISSNNESSPDRKSLRDPVAEKSISQEPLPSQPKRKLLKCPLCIYTSENKRQLTKHKFSHSVDKMFSCPRCSYVSNTKRLMDKHEFEVHLKMVDEKCTERSVDSSVNSLLPLSKEEETANAKNFSCCKCDFSTVNQELRDNHECDHLKVGSETSLCWGKKGEKENGGMIENNCDNMGILGSLSGKQDGGLKTSLSPTAINHSQTPSLELSGSGQMGKKVTEFIHEGSETENDSSSAEKEEEETFFIKDKNCSLPTSQYVPSQKRRDRLQKAKVGFNLRLSCTDTHNAEWEKIDDNANVSAQRTRIQPKSNQSVHTQSQTTKCSLCNFTTRNESLMKNHEFKHIKDSIPLNKRGEKNSFPLNKREIRTQKKFGDANLSKPKRYRCPSCRYSTKHLSIMKKHEVIHLKFKHFRCSKCSYATNALRNYKNHLRIHAKGFFSINSKKDKTRPSSSSLRMRTIDFAHNFDNCEKDSSNSFKNEICDIPQNVLPISNKKDETRAKSSKYSETTDVTPCQKTPDKVNGSLLITEIKTFTTSTTDGKTTAQIVSEETKVVFSDPETFKCSKCSFATKSRLAFVKHILVHSESKKFKCDECQFATRSYEYLRRHRKKHLVKTDNVAQSTIHPSSVRHPKLSKCRKGIFAGESEITLKKHLLSHAESNSCDDRKTLCPVSSNENLPLKTNLTISKKNTVKNVKCNNIEKSKSVECFERKDSDDFKVKNAQITRKRSKIEGQKKQKGKKISKEDVAAHSISKGDFIIRKDLDRNCKLIQPIPLNSLEDNVIVGCSKIGVRSVLNITTSDNELDLHSQSHKKENEILNDEKLNSAGSEGGSKFDQSKCQNMQDSTTDAEVPPSQSSSEVSQHAPIVGETPESSGRNPIKEGCEAFENAKDLENLDYFEGWLGDRKSTYLEDKLQIFKNENVSCLVNLKLKTDLNTMAERDLKGRFKCSKCCYTAKCISTVQKHESKAHSDMNDIRCDECSYTTHALRNMKRHRRKNHKKTVNNFQQVNNSVLDILKYDVCEFDESSGNFLKNHNALHLESEPSKTLLMVSSPISAENVLTKDSELSNIKCLMDVNYNQNRISEMNSEKIESFHDVLKLCNMNTLDNPANKDYKGSEKVIAIQSDVQKLDFPQKEVLAEVSERHSISCSNGQSSTREKNSLEITNTNSKKRRAVFNKSNNSKKMKSEADMKSENHSKSILNHSGCLLFSAENDTKIEQHYESAGDDNEFTGFEHVTLEKSQTSTISVSSLEVQKSPESGCPQADTVDSKKVQVTKKTQENYASEEFQNFRFNTIKNKHLLFNFSSNKKSADEKKHVIRICDTHNVSIPPLHFVKEERSHSEDKELHRCAEEENLKNSPFASQLEQVPENFVNEIQEDLKVDSSNIKCKQTFPEAESSRIEKNNIFSRNSITSSFDVNDSDIKFEERIPKQSISVSFLTNGPLQVKTDGLHHIETNNLNGSKPMEIENILHETLNHPNSPRASYLNNQRLSCSVETSSETLKIEEKMSESDFKDASTPSALNFISSEEEHSNPVENDLLNHEMTYREIKLLKCVLCSYVTNRKKNLKIHEKRCKKRMHKLKRSNNCRQGNIYTIFNCKECEFMGESDLSLKKHVCFDLRSNVFSCNNENIKVSSDLENESVQYDNRLRSSNSKQNDSSEISLRKQEIYQVGSVELKDAKDETNRNRQSDLKNFDKGIANHKKLARQQTSSSDLHSYKTIAEKQKKIQLVINNGKTLKRTYKKTSECKRKRPVNASDSVKATKFIVSNENHTSGTDLNLSSRAKVKPSRKRKFIGEDDGSQKRITNPTVRSTKRSKSCTSKPKSNKSKEELPDHPSANSEVERFKCLNCNYSSDKKSLLKGHELIHLKVKRLKCF